MRHFLFEPEMSLRRGRLWLRARKTVLFFFRSWLRSVGSFAGRVAPTGLIRSIRGNLFYDEFGSLSSRFRSSSDAIGSLICILAHAGRRDRKSNCRIDSASILLLLYIDNQSSNKRSSVNQHPIVFYLYWNKDVRFCKKLILSVKKFWFFAIFDFLRIDTSITQSNFDRFLYRFFEDQTFWFKKSILLSSVQDLFWWDRSFWQNQASLYCNYI